MIVRARAVVTMDGPPIEDGAVAVTGDTIMAVGKAREVRPVAGEEVIDLGDCAVLPGLINAHCHLDYTCLRGLIEPRESFTDWIRSINNRKAALTPNDYLRSIASGFDEAAAFGTTSIVNLEAFPQLIAAAKSSAMRTCWCAEMIDVRGACAVSEVADEVRRAVRANDPLQRGGLAPHAPYTASIELYRAADKIARESGFLLTTHLAESAEERAMFENASGRLYRFLQSIDREMKDCGRETSIAQTLRAGWIDERWLVAHLNEITESDLRLLDAAPRFHIVHCPRSHAYFGHAKFRLTELSSRGFNICLGTDSLASNHDLSLFREMRELSRVYPEVSAERILAMVTVNAAAALDEGKRLGRIRSGFAADLIAVPHHAAAGELFDELLAFDAQVPWRMLQGTAVARI